MCSLTTPRSRTRSLTSEAAGISLFEFHATLTHLDDGLETLHHSVQLLREKSGRGEDDINLMLFETALAEIGANAIMYGRPPGSVDPIVQYSLRLEGDTAIASLTHPGPPLHNQLKRTMPAAMSEAGRGLPIARKVLDELRYQRDGEVNTWRLVKRL